MGIDLFELKGHQYLLRIDYYSSTTSKAGIEHCKAIYERHRIPEIMVSDNGPGSQFSSRKFLTFSDQYGFTHLTNSPYHPQGNSEAEHAVQTLKHLLKKGEDLHIAVMNYRATPLQKGSSPAELLMGWKLTTRFPTVPSKYVPSVEKSHIHYF